MSQGAQASVNLTKEEEAVAKKISSVWIAIIAITLLVSNATGQVGCEADGDKITHAGFSGGACLTGSQHRHYG